MATGSPSQLSQCDLEAFIEVKQYSHYFIRQERPNKDIQSTPLNALSIRLELFIPQLCGNDGHLGVFVYFHPIKLALSVCAVEKLH